MQNNEPLSSALLVATALEDSGLVSELFQSSELYNPGESDLSVLQPLGGRFNFLFNEQRTWANATFGQNRTPLGALHHLAQEVAELIAEPYDRMEYADALLLLMDAAGNAGMTADDLIDSALLKQVVNSMRKWGAPDANGVRNHVRD